MALIPSQVLRVAILLSYFSILCHYKALDMPAHQTYGGSWKFLTFIDLVRLRGAVCLLTPRGGAAAPVSAFLRSFVRSAELRLLSELPPPACCCREPSPPSRTRPRVRAVRAWRSRP